MENERPIEKLLRRYAKKRRDEAGAPTELHPATRRVLQGEVARQFKKERSGKAAPAEASVRWWPRLVYGLCVFAVVAVLVAMLLPALNKAKSRSLSASNLRQIDLAARTFADDNNDRLPASFDQLSNELRTSTVTVDPVTGKPFVYVAGGLPLKTLRGDSVLAYSPPTNGRSSVLMADGSVRQMSAPEFAEISKRGLIQFEAPLELAKNEAVATSSARELISAKTAGTSGRTATGTTTEDFAKLSRAEIPASPGSGGGGAGTTTRSASATIAKAPRSDVAGNEEPVATAVAGAVAAAPALMPAATPPPATAPALKLDGFGDTSAAFYSANDVTKTNAMAVNVASYVNLDESRTRWEGGVAGRLTENQTASFRNIQKTPAKMAVLDSFQIEQNGNALRVIDNDGSTYDGNIVSREAQTAAGTSFGLSDKLEEKVAARKKESAGELNYKATQNSPSQNYFFRVAGTNRTLKQQVVFTGNFVSTTNAVQLGAPVQASQQMQNFQFFINNSTIVGKAQVEMDREIDVNAVPVTK